MATPTPPGLKNVKRILRLRFSGGVGLKGGGRGGGEFSGRSDRENVNKRFLRHLLFLFRFIFTPFFAGAE